MSEPLKLDEQKKSNWFVPNEKCGLYIGISKYDMNMIKKDKKSSSATKSFFKGLDDVVSDVENFSACMDKYNIKGVSLIDEPSKNVER